MQVDIRSGDGGPGAVAFRREKFQEKGGPSGGDGGNGGSVIFETDNGLTTLLDFHYRPKHEARNGQGGLGSDCNGRAADDLVLKVPVGTVIYEGDEKLADLVRVGERWVGAPGGRGGLGNMNFATSTRQAPRFAQPGTKGVQRHLRLELKLLADVGLVGFPNAGKSSLVARVSAARPKVADYPFTTLAPKLGVVSYKDRRSFVIADLPGLIEGASEGRGLGHRFLKHIERCRVLVILLDVSDETRDPFADYLALRVELSRYSRALADKPQLVAANKLDLPSARDALPALERALKRRRRRLYPLSVATGKGLDELLDACAELLFSPPAPPVRRRKKAPAPARKKPSRKKPVKKPTRKATHGARR